MQTQGDSTTSWTASELTPERLYRLAKEITGDPERAQTAAHDCFVALSSTPPGSIRRLVPWLRTVMRNSLRSERAREVNTLPTESLHGVACPQLEPSSHSAELEIRRAIAQAVARLKEPLRCTFRLRYYAGCSHAEVARLQGTSIGAARTRAHRGLQAIGEDLDRRFGGRAQWQPAMLVLGAKARTPWGAPGDAAKTQLAKPRSFTAAGWSLGSLLLLTAGGAATLALPRDPGDAGARVQAAALEPATRAAALDASGMEAAQRRPSARSAPGAASPPSLTSPDAQAESILLRIVDRVRDEPQAHFAVDIISDNGESIERISDTGGSIDIPRALLPATIWAKDDPMASAGRDDWATLEESDAREADGELRFAVSVRPAIELSLTPAIAEGARVYAALAQVGRTEMPGSWERLRASSPGLPWVRFSGEFIERDAQGQLLLWVYSPDQQLAGWRIWNPSEPQFGPLHVHMRPIVGLELTVESSPAPWEQLVSLELEARDGARRPFQRSSGELVFPVGEQPQKTITLSGVLPGSYTLQWINADLSKGSVQLDIDTDRASATVNVSPSLEARTVEVFLRGQPEALAAAGASVRAREAVERIWNPTRTQLEDQGMRCWFDDLPAQVTRVVPWLESSEWCWEPRAAHLRPGERSLEFRLIRLPPKPAGQPCTYAVEAFDRKSGKRIPYGKYFASYPRGWAEGNCRDDNLNDCITSVETIAGSRVMVCAWAEGYGHQMRTIVAEPGDSEQSLRFDLEEYPGWSTFVCCLDRNQDPVSGAEIVVDGVAHGPTDAMGFAVVRGSAEPQEIVVRKPGYRMQGTDFGLEWWTDQIGLGEPVWIQLEQHK